VLFVGLVLICASLLYNRTINGPAFALCIVASAAAVILLANTDRLEQLLFKQGDNELRVGLQQLERNVYARVEALRRIAEGVASMVAEGVARENRFTGEDEVEQMLRRRDDLVRFLSGDDVASQSSAAIVRPIELMADWDLRTRILVDARAAWKLLPGENPNQPPQRDVDAAKVKRVLETPDRLAALQELERLLRGDLLNRIPFEAVETHVVRLRGLIESGRLPKMVPADDMSTAPIR
jgi:hypothetical protein